MDPVTESSGSGRLASLLAIAVGLTLAAAALSMWISYSAALQAETERIAALAYSQAHLVDAVATFDSVESQDANPEGALMATMGQVAEGHAHWLARDPQLELAVILSRPEGATTLVHQGHAVARPHRRDSTNLAPRALELAFAGHDGGIRTQAADGRDVIVGYAWVEKPGLAVLVQVPAERIRTPFLHALTLCALCAFVIVLLGGLALRRVGLPLVHTLQRELAERRAAEAELARHKERLEHVVAERTAELQRAQVELLRSERLAALGKITGTVSHELRNPLGTLRNSLYSLAERTRGKELGIERILQRAEHSAQRCELILDELLAFARVKPIERVPTELGAWTRAVVDEYEVPGGFRIECQLAAAAWASVDREDLRRILVNLLTNAAHAVAEAHKTPASGLILVSTAEQGDITELRVQDNGAGIPPEVMPHVFEPLYSTKSFGVGLGLSIARDAALRNDGSLLFESTVGRGTTAIVRLPTLIQLEARRVS